MFDLLVTLLHPHAQPIQSDYLFQVRRGERWWGDWTRGRSRQVRHQIPGGEIGQGLWIGCGHHSSFRLVWPTGAGHNLHRPPLLSTAITEGSGDRYPFTRVLGTFPPSLVRHVLQGTCHVLWMPPGVRGFECHHIRHFQLAQPASQATILSIERVSYHRTERPSFLDRLVDELQGDFELGAKGGIVPAFGKIAL